MRGGAPNGASPLLFGVDRLGLRGSEQAGFAISVATASATSSKRAVHLVRVGGAAAAGPQQRVGDERVDERLDPDVGGARAARCPGDLRRPAVVAPERAVARRSDVHAGLGGVFPAEHLHRHDARRPRPGEGGPGLLLVRRVGRRKEGPRGHALRSAGGDLPGERVLGLAPRRVVRADHERDDLLPRESDRRAPGFRHVEWNVVAGLAQPAAAIATPHSQADRTRLSRCAAFVFPPRPGASRGADDVTAAGRSQRAAPARLALAGPWGEEIGLNEQSPRQSRHSPGNPRRKRFESNSQERDRLCHRARRDDGVGAGPEGGDRWHPRLDVRRRRQR